MSLYERLAARPGGLQDLAAARLRYNVEAVPMLILADRDGVVRASFVGPLPADALSAALGKVGGA